MSSEGTLELLVRTEGERTLLLSPGVGWLSAAAPHGAVLAPGQCAGVLDTLGARAGLIVPADVRGTIVSSPPLRLRAPVDYGAILYELAAQTGPFASSPERAATARANGELVVRAPQSGRFYHRSAPGEPVLCDVGRELEVGTPIGLIEVMKTFTQVVYRVERDLPPRATILRVLAADGSEVDQGTPLVAIARR